MHAETKGWKYHWRTLLLVPSTLGMTGLVVMVFKKDTLLPEDAERVPLNFKLWLLPGNFGFLVPKDQKARREVSVMARVTDTDYQEEVGLLLHNDSREEYV